MKKSVRWTAKQKEILSVKGLCDVKYENMWSSKKELGYSYKGFRHYGVCVAKDVSSDIRAAILIHEIAHAYLGHLDTVDYKKELEDIRNIFREVNKPYERISYYGGPMSFLNICMDLEINSTILTTGNIESLNSIASICTPDKYKVEILESFRDYYRPLISQIPDADENESLLKLPSNLRDLADRVDPITAENIPEEIRDALAEENYLSGNEKESNKDKDDYSIPISTKDAAAFEEASFEEEHGRGIGAGHGAGVKTTLKETAEKKIQKFLARIIRHDLLYYSNPIRHYNRGTRRNNDGILYNSRCRKVNKNTQRVAILVDVSGSMYTESLTTALSTFKNSSSLIAGNSKLYTWDTNLIQEFDINSVPNEFALGGGTDIAKGLRFLLDKGFEDIIVYSDFKTRMDSLISAAEDLKANLYSIVVPIPVPRDYLFDKYISLNRSCLFI